MRIVDVRVHPVRVARRYATRSSIDWWGSAAGGGGSGRAERPWLSHYYDLEIETDGGLVGLGEVSDIQPDATLIPGQRLRAPAYERLLRELLRGLAAYEVARIGAVLFRAGLRPELAFAVDAACHDLMARAAGQPLYNLLGGRYWPEPPVCWVAYIRHPREMEPEIAEKVAQGFRAFKLKVGRDVDLDVERVRLVRELAGPEAYILLDANAAWGVETAIAALRRLEAYRPAGIETPIAPDDLGGMVQVKRHTSVPYVEHAGSAAQMLAYLRHGAVDVFCVYPPSYGGYRAAQQVLGMIAAAGKQAYVGSDVEMGVGTVALGHFAAASPECDALAWPCTLRGPLLLVDDVLAEPARYDRGSLLLPAAPGLGVRLDPTKLRQLAGDLP